MNSRFMRRRSRSSVIKTPAKDRLEMMLGVYQRYKEIAQSSPIERGLKKIDATDLDPVDSDAMMLRSLTIQIRQIVIMRQNKKIIENTDFSCAADAAEKVEVYKERLKISSHIEHKMSNFDSKIWMEEELKVLTKDEMINLLQETVRESVSNSGKARVGYLTERKVRKVIKEAGWEMVERNVKFMSQDIYAIFQDKNENKYLDS